ncbi:MAG: FG-GAP-like repeat-containing protein [Steroidobacteraceae bacterium]|jgi:RHS repeat-associated protein|nr:FG-GAP-like repeat-containing protein [Steroidobacteraceae bacterium]
MNTRTHRALPFLGTLLLFFPLLAASAVGRTPGTAWVTPAGAAAYSIALALPPGTAGLTPALSLEYRHNQHGGLLGVGWSLGGLSQISRCPRTDAQDGAAAPIQYSLQDRFCLDGQRLVVVNGVAYGAAGSEYRTEIESYARIRAHGTAGAGPQHFVVESADGRILEYGATADSRIDAGGRIVSGVATPRTWALSRIRDRAGNVIDFQYLEDATQRSHRISSVKYNGNPALGIAPSHAVQFAWESRPSSEVDLSYVAGTPIRQIVRLDRIDVLHEGQVVRRYDLTYEPALSSAGRSRLASVQECGAGGSDCLASTTFRWQDGVPGLGAELPVPLALSTGSSSGPHSPWITADVNGDGHDDLLWTAGIAGASTLRYRLGGANGFGPEVDTGIVAAKPGWPFDYNGDGRADLLNIAPTNHWRVIPGAAGGLGAPVVTSFAAHGHIDFRGADVNGDGLGDIVWSEVIGNSWMDLVVRVRHAQAGGGFAATPVTLYEQGMHTGYDWPEGGQFLGQPGQRIDLDGDGREDLMMDERYSVARITAAGVTSDWFDGAFAGAVPLDLNADGCTDLAYLHYTGRWRARYSGCGSPYWAAPEVDGPAWSGSPYPQVFDWNGDGQQDLLLRGSTAWQVMLSGGDRLLPIQNTGLAHATPDGLATADVNGDGLDDLLARSPGQLRLRLHGGPRPDLLASATDGFDVSASFAYAPLTRPEAYTRHSGATFPQRDVQDARPVVVGLARGDGAGSSRSTRYAYEGLRLDLQGRGSLGFARRIATETSAGTTLRTEESWRQDFPFTGLPQARVLRQASGRAVVETSWQYAQLTLGSGAAQRRRPYLSESSERVYEAGGAYDGLHHTTRSYSTAHVDATSGLVLDASWTTTEHGTGLNAGASRTQRLWHTGVLNDTANWCLGRPLGAQLTESHTLAGGSALTRNVALSWDGLRCRPTQQQVEPGSSQWQVTTALGYDAFGNVSSVAVTGAGMATRTTRVAWGPRGQAPASVTDPLSQMRAIAWDAARGLPLSVTDENGLVTRWTYDALGRLDSELRPDGTRRVVARSACSAATDCGDPAARYRVRSSEQSPWAVTHRYEEWSFDSLDRWVVHREQQANGALSVRSRRFDGLGRLWRENLPHWPGAAAGYLQHAYDLLDRPTGVGLHAASGALVRSAGVEYRGLALTERNALGRPSTRTVTAWGDLVSVTDAAGGESRYRHDAAGRLLQVADAYGSIVTSLEWNLRGMKVAQTDMDLGQWTFTPNALGELVALRDARGQQATFAYDALSRLVRRTEPEGTTAWTWGRPVDNTAGARVAGRLTQVAGPGYAEQYGYDALSRPVRRAIVADATYEYAYGYNTLGQLDSLTYPASTSGYRLKLGYDYAHGQLTRIRDFNAPATTFWKLEAVDAAGRLLDEMRGAGLRIITGRDPLTGQVDYRQSGIGGGAAVQNLAWRWDANGNMVERSDLNRGVTERFNYDALDRLDNVRRNGALTLDLAYDFAGNITSRSDVGSYAYHPTRKHAVVTAGSRSYAYDANGNMTSRAGAAIAWTSFNLPVSISGAGGASSAFWYGPDRQRWKQVASSGGASETTVYAGSLLEKVVRGTATEWKHYVATPGGLAAIHVRATDGSAPRTLLLTQDALGSTDRIVDGAGTTQLATSFEPFGARRGASWSGGPTATELAAAGRTTRDGFTGHEQLDHLGLVHMGGRVYDPVIGRFLSPDPIVQAPFWSQDLNRYSYAWNNPLSIVDPTGYTEEVPCRSFDDACAQVVVTGRREFPDSFDGLSSLQLAWLRAGYNGQAASAWERDPCGQDGSANACRLSGRDAGPPAPVSPVANVGAPLPVDMSQRGAAYYLGKGVEWIGYTLIAFDLANAATGVLVGPDTSLIGGPLVAAGIQLRHASARPEAVVIGESMRRVRAYADELAARGIQARTYQAPNMTRSLNSNSYGSTESMDANWHWIDYWARRRGAQVIDIGPQPGRATPSPYYQMERRNIDRWERQGQIPPVTRVDPGY